MVEREFLGARARGQSGAADSIADNFIRGEGEQIIAEGFSFVGKAGLDEAKEGRVVRHREGCAFAGQAHGDKGGIDLGRGAEGSGRNFQGDLGMRKVLARDREIAAVATAGLGDDALGDFELDDNVDRGDSISPLKKMMEDRGSDVVRQIAVDAESFIFGEARAAGEGEQIE